MRCFYKPLFGLKIKTIFSSVCLVVCCVIMYVIIILICKQLLVTFVCVAVTTNIYGIIPKGNVDTVEKTGRAQG